ncbi:hydrolase [Marinomonas agarivorans]|nr:hydrolase [Marinomonas agarivorans]
MKKITLTFSITLILVVTLSTGCSTFGELPSGEHLLTIQKSPNYSHEREEFVNRKVDAIDAMKERASIPALIKNLFSGNEEQTPDQKLPEKIPDIEAFIASKKGAKVIWFGHSTFLLNLDGTTILVDPVFSQAASPFSFLIKRFQPPVIPLTDLPRVDFILISHDHYDHLDMKTVQFFKDKNSLFVTPLGVGSHLKAWGIAEHRIVEKDWWESHSEEGITFISTPAQHFSGRNGIDENQTLWSSWIIQKAQHNLYFSGDSGYDTHFATIGDKYGPFDVAFLENGQYDPLWREVHLLPEQTVQASRDLQARKLFPIHWGMFDLSTHSWNEPITELINASKGDVDLIIPKFGEVVDLQQDYVLESWWQKAGQLFSSTE